MEMALKRIFELATTTTTEIGGAAFTGAALSPVVWLKQIVDAAKQRHLALQFAYQTELQPGQRDVIVPIRTHYIGSGTANTWAGTAGQGSAVSFTALTNLCGIVLSPVDQNYGVAMSNRAIRTNALDVIRHAREELVYVVGDEVDRAIFTEMADNAYDAAAGARGAQTAWGGDATRASELAAGDVITTDLVAEAKRKLQSTTQTYPTLGTGDSIATVKKNPWMNEPGAPFVLFIAPEQEEAFLTDSQFISAAEYGSDKIIHNGEIGDYLGIKIVVSNNTRFYDASTTHDDTTTTAVAQHRCELIKAQKAVAFAWGLKPRLRVFDFPTNLETRLVIEQSYKASVLHRDAIVHIDVSDS